MKRHSAIKIAFAVLLSANTLELCAQHHWAMAIMEKGMERPVVMQYHGNKETAENGIVYYRIFNDEYVLCNDDYIPVKLQYGYRLADKKIFVYDFNNNEETLAFDFNLSAGDQFTTFNGMEWEVEAVKDTLVNIYYNKTKGAESKKLLSVKSLDGQLTDKWLEDFGSFTYHFMINSMENIVCAQTLWMEYSFGDYIAREVHADPIYSHDSGYQEGTYDNNYSSEYTKCTYENGQVVFENVKWWYPHREYSCFYREGDDIYRVYDCGMNPMVDIQVCDLVEDVITFNGLPAPASGKYTIHYDNNNYTTGIENISNIPDLNGGMYDMQGRRLLSQPTKGIYIKDGKKHYAK